jgi:hypothetical protein
MDVTAINLHSRDVSTLEQDFLLIGQSHHRKA